MDRTLVSSGSPYEPVMGFSRAVRVGNHVSVAGTAPIMPEGGPPPVDPSGQTRRCLEIILAALAEAGAGPEHVVRMTWYLTDKRDYLARARELGEVYRARMGRHYPVMAVVEVSALIEDRAKIEIETTAVLPEGGPSAAR